MPQRKRKGHVWRKGERILIEAHLRLDTRDGERAVEFVVVLTSRHSILSREVNYRDGKVVKSQPWRNNGQSSGWRDHKGRFTRYWRGRGYSVTDVSVQTAKLVKEMEKVSRAARVV